MTQLRRDPIRGHWTIVAPGRSQRPDEYVVRSIPPSNEEPCPFCPGNEHLTPPEIDAVRPTESQADEPGWLVRVIPNRYPALGSDLSVESPPERVTELHRSQPALGTQEIVVATPEHSRKASGFSVDHWDKVLAACQYRMEQLAKDRQIKHVLLFQNHGAEGGASRSHAHLQIMGLPMTPQAIAHELLNGRNYYNRHRRCLFCDVLAKELEEKTRIVLADDLFVTYAPWASRLPYELWVMPRPHHSSFLKVPTLERRRLAAHLKDVLQRLEKLFGDFAYNWFVHTAPLAEGDTQIFHWHIEILPRLGQQAGYEWATGGFINPTAPEAAANDLRAVEVK